MSANALVGNDVVAKGLQTSAGSHGTHAPPALGALDHHAVDVAVAMLLEQLLQLRGGRVRHEYARENPWRALAIAVGTGFVVGLIFERR